MSLNIKNERVHELAREAARVTGQTQTSAIEEALRRLLREYGADPEAAERDRRVVRMLEIGRRFRDEEPPLPDDEPIKSAEDLYDEKTGLSR